MANRVVLITGGTGLIGKEITNVLINNGFTVHILTRKPQSTTLENLHYFHWDVKKHTIDEKCFRNVQYVFHLAGAPIAKRWTDAYKKEILNSRVKSAQFLLQKMKEHKINLKCYVGASASGYYAPNTGNVLYEANQSGYGFLTEVCKKWEEAHEQFQQIAKRVVIHRIGLVLAENGGALEKMLPSFHFHIATQFGSGNQFYPCIHLSDVANQFVYSLINNKLQGPYNAAVETVSQKQLNKFISQGLNKKTMTIAIPKWLLQLFLGKMHFLVTDSLKMSGDKIKNEGFNPQFPTVEFMLEDILQKKE